MIPWFNDSFHYFSQRLRENRCHHALLLIGPQHTEKLAMLTTLAQRVLCTANTQLSCGVCQSCQLFNASSHPDFYTITTETTQIGVDSIRAAIESLHGSAQLGGNKCLIIPNAHKMTVSAANALLKTLEEPSDNTFILLSATKPSELLPTVLSRCEKHNIALPSTQTVKQWLSDSHGVEMSEAEIEAYSALPSLCLRSAKEKQAILFTDFEQLLLQLRQSHPNIVALAQQWQLHSGNLILWLSNHVRQLPLSQKILWHDVNNAINDLEIALHHPGVNKSLLLEDLFRRLQKKLCS